MLEPSVLKVMIAFLGKANWKATTWYDGRSKIEVPRGSFITSYAKMAEICRLSLKQVRSSFCHLRKLEFAAYTRAGKWTMVTVRNFETYQGSEEGQGKVEGTSGALSGHDNGRIRAPIEEGNKGRTDIRASKNDARVGELSAVATIRRPNTAEPDGCPPLGASSSRASAAQVEAWFNEWWAEYWLHKAKKPAREAFSKLATTPERFQRIMAATRAQRGEMLARPPDKRPYGATWLNQERWNDSDDQPLSSDPRVTVQKSHVGYNDMESWKKGIA
jgi:hypothetical protein